MQPRTPFARLSPNYFAAKSFGVSRAIGFLLVAVQTASLRDKIELENLKELANGKEPTYLTLNAKYYFNKSKAEMRVEVTRALAT